MNIGSSATYDVRIALEGEPYALADIAAIKYLLFDAAAEKASSLAAEAIEDGLYQVVLSADQTSGLKAGSNRLEVIVVPLVVSVPTIQSLEFVTTP